MSVSPRRIEAWVVERLGEPGDVMSLRSTTLREPGPGEVVVEVEACGVNFADVLSARGRYQDQPEVPFTPGTEVAGVVVAVGEGAGLTVGQSVVGSAAPPEGAYATHCIAPAADLMPRTSDAVTAAASHVAAQTAWFGLKHRARLAPGEWVLIHAAAGGTGSAALALAREMGARTIAVAGGADKLALCAEMGADACLDRRSSDLRAEVAEITAGYGVDVVYDPVGGDAAEQSLRCLAFEGRLVVVGFASGRVGELPANHVMVKNVDVVGIAWPAYRARRPEMVRAAQRDIDELLATGRFRPLIGPVRPLGEAAEALGELAAGTTSGKTVLVPEGGGAPAAYS